jgi:hypothetical protein
MSALCQKRTSGRPAIYSWKLLLPLWTVWEAPPGRPRDYGIADAQMLRNAAAREEENQ